MGIPAKQEQLDELDAAREAAVLGSKRVEVEHRDGRKEKVTVRLLPMRLMPDYQRLAYDEAACIELFCGKDAPWADTLTAASHLEVLQAGEDLNQRPLSDFLDRQAKRQQKLMPGLTEELLKQITANIAAQPNNHSGTSPRATSRTPSPSS